MIGRQRALPMLEDAIHVDHGAHIVFGQHLDLVDFVRSAEAVEEMQERDAGFERRRMRDQRQVHRFLNRVRAEHGEAGGAAEHHVASDRRKSRARAVATVRALT